MEAIELTFFFFVFARFTTPDSESLLKGVMNDELDLEMAQTKEETENVMRAKSSKSWRVLRLSLKSKLSAFDKIEDGKNMQALLEKPSQATEAPKAPADGENISDEHDHGPSSVEEENATAAEQTLEASMDSHETETKQISATVT